MVGERGEFGGVVAEALRLVHGEDDAAVRGVGLDLAGECERGLELGLEFLGERRAPRVPDADVGARGVRHQGERAEAGDHQLYWSGSA